jgi:cytochrome b561
VTDDDRSQPASFGRIRYSMAGRAFHTNLALLVLVVGLLGLLHDAVSIPARQSACLHVLFGVLLWVCCVTRFYRGVHQAPAMLPMDTRVLVRGLSRSVYLLLYVLMLFQIAIGIVRARPRQPILGPAEAFQSYLACGLIALATIHLLAALYRHFPMHGARPALHYSSAKRPADVG